MKPRSFTFNYNLLGFNSEITIQEQERKDKKENTVIQGEIPAILYQRKKYKGKKKKWILIVIYKR